MQEQVHEKLILEVQIEGNCLSYWNTNLILWSLTNTLLNQQQYQYDAQNHSITSHYWGEYIEEIGKKDEIQIIVEQHGKEPLPIDLEVYNLELADSLLFISPQGYWQISPVENGEFFTLKNTEHKEYLYADDEHKGIHNIYTFYHGSGIFTWKGGKIEDEMIYESHWKINCS